MAIFLSNNDPFGNQFRVNDNNNGNNQIWSGYINAHGTQDVYPLFNASGYANITTYQDNNNGIGHSFLHDGDTVSV